MGSKRSRESDNSSNDEPKAKRQPKMLDGTYFKLIENDEPNNQTEHIKAQCMFCKDKPNIIKGSYTSTGNFHKHFSRKHPEILNQLKNYCSSSYQNQMVSSSKQNRNDDDQLTQLISLDPNKVSFIFI